MSKIRKFYLAAALLFGLTTVGAVVAWALPSHEIETTYFSDATLTGDVGWSILLCDGSYYRTGTVTPYFLRKKTPC